MADNVDIIVQDTINEIVVNAAVVVETIDINVQVAVDEVTIIANPNDYIINVNRIIGEQVQSDWNVTDDQAPDYIKNKPIIPSIEGLATVTYVDQQDALKVDKVVGKGLSTNDFTDTLKTKLDGIQDGAEVNINADWNATSGDAQILNKPTIPAAVTKTSDLTNDGEDGVNPFITLNDIPPSTSTLNDVLTNGNTSLLDAKVGALGLWDTGNSYYNKIGSIGNAFYFMRNDGAALFVTEAGYSRFSTDYGTLELSNAGIIGIKTINWPDASGTVALTSDIINPTLDNVLTNGDTSLLNANIGVLGLWDNANGGYSTIEVSDNSFTLKNTSADSILRAEQSILSLHQTSSIAGNFAAYNITESRNYELPDKSGIIALTSDIPSIPTLTSQLTNDGANGVDPFITALDIPTNGLPAGGTAGQILTKVDATDYNATWQENFADWTSVVKHTVKNNGLSGTITKGTAVYVTGSDGTNMLVGRASNASEATSSKTMGLMQSDITTTGGNQTGFVVTEGLLSGLNTAGQTAGDPVWLGVNGALIYGLANKPYAPAHLVFIGIVTKISAGNGEIFVKVQNGFELNEIHDVDLITTTPINGHLLGFDGTLWVNKTIAGWLGYTPISGTGTTNYLPKFTGTSALGNSLIFDNGTNVGIGTTAPAARLQVNAPGALSTDIAFKIRNSADTRNFLVVNGAGDVYNNGAGGINSSTIFGENSGRNSSGGNNTFFGNAAGFAATSGGSNTAIGSNSLALNTTGVSNTSIGVFTLLNVIGNNNIGIGFNAGRYIANGATSLTTSSESIFIGNVSRSNANGEANQIVIGHNAIGLGSNTVVLGNDSITKTALKGQIAIGTTTPVASAKVQIDSTTQGFLPPRMTNAQRIAIATPAVGLCVYCTDVVEGLYINKSTGWTYIG